MISMPHLTEYADRWWAGCDCKSCSIPPSNADPADGTVNEDGAVWVRGRWHLTGVHSLLGCDEDAVTSVYRAACSCGWYGPKRVKQLAECGRGATVSISAQLLATEDGQRHTGEPLMPLTS